MKEKQYPFQITTWISKETDEKWRKFCQDENKSSYKLLREVVEYVLEHLEKKV